LTSGIRAGGHLKPSPHQQIINNAQKYGLEAALELARFEIAHIPAMKELVEKENIDCDFHITRAVDVQLDDDYCQKVKQSYDNLVKARISVLADVEYIPEPKAERVSPYPLRFWPSHCFFAFLYKWSVH
jgi:hypothetical protein